MVNHDTDMLARTNVQIQNQGFTDAKNKIQVCTVQVQLMNQYH